MPYPISDHPIFLSENLFLNIGEFLTLEELMLARPVSKQFNILILKTLNLLKNHLKNHFSESLNLKISNKNGLTDEKKIQVISRSMNTLIKYFKNFEYCFSFTDFHRQFSVLISEEKTFNKLKENYLNSYKRTYIKFFFKT